MVVCHLIVAPRRIIVGNVESGNNLTALSISKNIIMKLFNAAAVYVTMLLTTPSFSANIIAQQDNRTEYIVRNSGLLKLNSLEGTGGIPERSVNMKVVRSFRANYPEVSGEKWRLSNGQFIVSFFVGVVQYKIVYTKDGSLVYSLKMYEETDLPKRIRAMVKSIYYDYDIKTVQELSRKGKVVFFIQMRDAYKWKSVQVCEGELIEVSAYAE